jgi:hypothetical protein
MRPPWQDGGRVPTLCRIGSIGCDIGVEAKFVVAFGPRRFTPIALSSAMLSRCRCRSCARVPHRGILSQARELQSQL